MQVTFGSFNVTCTKEGSKSVDGYAGTFDCPDPNAYCQTYGTDFCPRGCMGRGNCVENVCQCDEGWGGADCSVKTFVRQFLFGIFVNENFYRWMDVQNALVKNGIWPAMVMIVNVFLQILHAW